MYCRLENRSLLKIEGPDARDFLQGLVSQDMSRVTADQAVYSAFLSPQGKFQFDFFGIELNGDLLLDCERDRAPAFLKRLSMYKLKSDVRLSDVTDGFEVFALMHEDALQSDRGAAQPFGGGVLYTDPRLSALGGRAVLPINDPALDDHVPGTHDDYERNRLSLGIADGSRDMTIDKALLLEYGYEELDGVSFSKGCFMGQELTARTRYRGLVKKRLLPVSIDGPLPAPGSIILLDDVEVGEMKTGLGDQGVALLRLDRFEKDNVLECEGAMLRPSTPDWVEFQKDKEPD